MCNWSNQCFKNWFKGKGKWIFPFHLSGPRTCTSFSAQLRRSLRNSNLRQICCLFAFINNCFMVFFVFFHTTVWKQRNNRNSQGNPQRGSLYWEGLELQGQKWNTKKSDCDCEAMTNFRRGVNNFTHLGSTSMMHIYSLEDRRWIGNNVYVLVPSWRFSV